MSMVKRYVKHAIVRWNDDDGARRYGFRGQEVEMPSEEAARLEKHDAVFPEGYDPSASPAAAGVADDGGAPVEMPDLDGGAVEDVAAWLNADPKPNAKTVVDAAEGDVDRAQLLLDAEQLARGGDARTTVVEPLRKIIDEGGAP